MVRRLAIALVLFSASLCLGQEPTKSEWIAAMQNQKKKADPVAELSKKYQEVLDGKIQNGGSTGYDNGWKFGSKREKQAKLDEAKKELVTAKRKAWASTSSIYPEVDAFSLKKGDVGIIMTSLSELTNRPPVSSGDPSAFLRQWSEMNTSVQSYKVLQVLGPKEFLCNCGKTTILVSGRDTSDLRDGAVIESIGLMYCVGNATYPTANGTNTVMKVIPVSNQVADRLVAETKGELSETRVRTWTDITGKHKIDAELLDYDGKKVTLKKTDGSKTELPIGKLSKADRQYCEEVLGAPEK